MYKMDKKQYLHEVGQNLADLFYNQKNINMKQTAVEWLIDQVKSHKYIEDVDFEQAKAMEKEQMIEFACKVAQVSAEKYIQGKTTLQIAEELLTKK